MKTQFDQPVIETAWKDTVIPDGFTLCVDTREQSPLFVERRLKPKETVTRGKLPILSKSLLHGDYSVKGFEDKICVERKHISDFYNYIGKERAGTIVKLEAMQEMYWKALVVEAEEKDILHPQFASNYTQLTKEQIRGFLISVNCRFRVHTYFTSDRDRMERWVLDRLCYIYKKIREGNIKL